MVIGLDGRMNESAGDLAGLTQEEADVRVIAWLEERGLLEKRDHYRHAVGTCERCHTRIEPLDLAAVVVRDGGACGAGDRGAARAQRPLSPESQHRFAIASLEEAPDWCISRQLWWGHQLPIWTTARDGHLTCDGGRSRRRARVRLAS